MAIKRTAKAKTKANKGGAKTPTPSVRLFEDFSFGGDYQDYSGDTAYIGDDLNKKVSSLSIDNGKWQFYADRNFNKPVGKVVYPGAYKRTTDVGIPNDTIASMKVVP